MSLYFQRRRAERKRKQAALIKQALELNAKKIHDEEPKIVQDKEEAEEKPKKRGRRKKVETNYCISQSMTN